MHQHTNRVHAPDNRRCALLTRTVGLWPWGACALVTGVALLVSALVVLAHPPTRQASDASSARSSTPSAGPWGPKAPNSSARPLQGNKGTATCNELGQLACPTPDPGWVPVASESTLDILAAAMSTDMYANEARDPSNHIAGLDTPVLVVPYRAHTGVAYYDDRHYVIRTHDAAGHPSGTFDFLYDRAHRRLAFSSFGVASPKDPFYARPFPPGVSQEEAVRLVYTQRGVGVMPAVAPELIFFPPDSTSGSGAAPLMWSGGGFDPLQPMWHMRGADGTEYFVGIDGRVYTDAQLPIAPNQRGSVVSG